MSDNFKEEDYVQQLTDRAEVLGGLTAQAHSKLHEQQRFLGRMEGLLLAFAIGLLVMGFALINTVDNFHERVDLIDVKIQKLEQSL